MNGLRVLALLIYTFGAFAYGALLALWVGWIRHPVADERRRARRNAQGKYISGVLWAASFVWFTLNVLQVVLALDPAGAQGTLWFAVQVATFLIAIAFPPLIIQTAWTESRAGGPVPGRWSIAVWLAYALSAAVGTVCTLGFFGIGMDVETAAGISGVAVAALFIGAAAYSIALMSRYPAAPELAGDPRSKRWHIALFASMALLFILVLSLDRRSAAEEIVRGALEVAVKSLPLAFMFVGTYFESRFEFFDIFVKRGLSLLTTMALLAFAFAVALPLLDRYGSTWAAPWVYAVALLPLAMALPWLHARIGAMLDRRWLGRRFSTVDAVKRFLSALRSATTEAQLVERAEDGLSGIFDAPVAVRLTTASEAVAPFEVVERIAITAAEGTAGLFLLGARRSHAPYFSEDVALLGSLADVFASVLDNLRLQLREQEQDRRARDLSLHASRSELKALRAQINPHFLFNALNAIAGLIHRNPAVADRTVEKLADVFRYALRGSEAEWTILDDELEFVRAYLDVEQARFGERLSTDVRLAEGARGARVPTMVVQTLVENAVKHGAANVRERALVSVEARRDRDRLLIVVEDNGPGLPPGDEPPPPSRRGGYGLANIRGRLEGYFGADATLSIVRDSGRARTVAAIEMPFVTHDARLPQAAGVTEAGP
jgi:signal transduction histidine kinase